MGSFVPNPAFRPHLIRATSKALEDVAQDLQRIAQAKATWSRRARSGIYAKLRPDAFGGSIVFSTGGGLQNIAERPKGTRQTKSGARRGTMKRFPVMEPTVAEVIPKGLPLGRHL